MAVAWVTSASRGGINRRKRRIQRGVFAVKTGRLHFICGRSGKEVIYLRYLLLKLAAG
jgi:hypothetical protein